MTKHPRGATSAFIDQDTSSKDNQLAPRYALPKRQLRKPYRPCCLDGYQYAHHINARKFWRRALVRNPFCVNEDGTARNHALLDAPCEQARSVSETSEIDSFSYPTDISQSRSGSLHVHTGNKWSSEGLGDTWSRLREVQVVAPECNWVGNCLRVWS